MNYIPNSEETISSMLKDVGVEDIDSLFTDIPEELQYGKALDIPEGLSEMETAARLGELGEKNILRKISFLGGGTYHHYIPAAVKQIISRGEFYTAYTPYQPEVSQGGLQGIFEYQSMICRLTGMDAANASMYDGSSALAEAGMMSCSITRRQRLLVSAGIHPRYREVLETYCRARDIDLVTIPLKEGKTDLEILSEKIDKTSAGVLIQSPNFLGLMEDLGEAGDICHGVGGIYTVNVVEPLVLGLAEPPGSFGADIVVGEGQSFGNPVNFGGPHLGIMACRKKYIRKFPGRVVGMTQDGEGKKGFVLTLQAREQHIRRESATSNICTNQALCALAATVYLALLGGRGLRNLARINLERAHYAADRLAALPGFELPFEGPFFNEFAAAVPDTKEVKKRLKALGMEPGIELSRWYGGMENLMLFCVTELISKSDIDRMAEALK